VIYEAQMLILENSETNLCCFVIKDNKIDDFLFARKVFKVLSKERKLNP